MPTDKPMTVPFEIRVAGLALCCGLWSCSTPSTLSYSEIRVQVTRPAEFGLSSRIESIAVTGFVVRTDARGLDERAISRGIEDGVAGSVRDQGFLEVIERQQLEHAKRELELGFADAFDQDSAARFGQLAQAQAVVFGEISANMTENQGPFQRESASSLAAREDWGRRKDSWEYAEFQRRDAWMQRRAAWEDEENARALQASTEQLLWQLAVTNNGGVHPQGLSRPPGYDPRPFREPEVFARPFLEPEPLVRMETWYFIEQRLGVQVTAKMVDVETGAVVGSTRFSLAGNAYRDQNANQSGLRREVPDKLIQPLLPQVVSRLTTAITPYKSVVTRKATSLNHSPLQERLDRTVRYLQEAPELAEPILNAIRDELNGVKKPDRLARACVENNTGIVAEAQGDFDTALEHYRRAISNDPDNETFVRQYADLKRVAEEHAKAARQSSRN